MIYRMVPFLMMLNDPNQNLKGMPLFNVECLRNSAVLVRTYTCPTKRCNFAWSRVI